MPGPLLEAREGARGSFIDWLHDLGLSDILRRHPLSQLIEWQWITPHSRVIFPADFFEQWDRYPEAGISHPPHLQAHSLLWDSNWTADNPQEHFWFLHPFFRPGNESASLLSAGMVLEGGTPDKIAHGNGALVAPYADYFFPWQGYQLVQTTISASCIPPLLLTPDIETRAAGMVRLAAELQNLDPRPSFKPDGKWAALKELFEMLAHYQAFRGAMKIDGVTLNEQQQLRKRGAAELAQHLGATESTMLFSLKKHLLVLAQDWLWANERHNFLTCRAWPHLQSDIHCLVEWLCMLSGRSFDSYFEELSYNGLGQREWAQLHDALPYESFSSKEKFLRIAPVYLSMYKEAIPENELPPLDLEDSTGRLLSENHSFSGLLSSFRRMHEDLTYRSDRHGLPDFKERRPIDHYLAVAIRTEGVLRTAISNINAIDSLPRRHGLVDYIRFLSSRSAGLSADVIDDFCEKAVSLTSLHAMPRDPILTIVNLQLQHDSRSNVLIRSFLCCVLARNYFAHHSYLDQILIDSKQSALLMAGLIATPLYLA